MTNFQRIPANLVIFTEEILNGNIHFCAVLLLREFETLGTLKDAVLSHAH